MKKKKKKKKIFKIYITKLLKWKQGATDSVNL